MGQGLAGRVHETLIRVRYADTDQAGMVYHANYFLWFEVGRAEYMRAMGLPYREVEASYGLSLPVVECWASYRWPARYDDLVAVRTRMAALSRLRLTFEYEAINVANGRSLALGRTVHVFVGREGRPRRLGATSPLWRRLVEIWES